MAYQFNKPKSPNKPIHIILTSLLAVLAIAILTVWLVIGYLQNRPVEQPETPEDTNSIEEIVTDPATCLVILDMDTNLQYLLIHTVPASKQVVVAVVPNNLAIESGDTLNDLLMRNGPAKVTECISEQLELPLNHYVYLTASGVNKFLNTMEKGVSVQLPEPITYTDENGITSTLSAGKVNLTAGQATAVLSYAKWKKPQNMERMASHIATSLINDYLTTDYSPKGFFGTLSNVAQTNLRIDNYTAYASALNYLAESNTGDITTEVKLDGELQNDRFVINLTECRRNSGLYH